MAGSCFMLTIIAFFITLMLIFLYHLYLYRNVLIVEARRRNG